MHHKIQILRFKKENKLGAEQFDEQIMARLQNTPSQVNYKTLYVSEIYVNTVN